MSRLTKKANHYCDTDIDNEYKFADEDVSIGTIVDKLGKLEDLEEELGCPLEVVFRALKEGIYQADGGRRKYPIIEYNGATDKFFFGFGTYCNVEDYGKEWFLKEDKSE